MLGPILRDRDHLAGPSPLKPRADRRLVGILLYEDQAALRRVVAGAMVLRRQVGAHLGAGGAQ